MADQATSQWRTVFPWAAIGTVLFACLSVTAAIDHRFDYDVDVIDMPIPVLVALLMLAGAVFLLLSRLIEGYAPAPQRMVIFILAWIMVAGLAMRLVFLGTVPVLEDDYNRYLLDGAVTAAGLSPYANTPLAVIDGETGIAVLERIRTDAPVILERINYPGLSTVYPPIAQAAFALAHWIAPWSLDAWRVILLAADLAVCGFILLILRSLARSSLWVSVYWWNPVVVKEFHNSAHMDLLVMLAVAAAIFFLIRARPYATAVAAAVGIGAKLWPVLLVPTLMRGRFTSRSALYAAFGVGAALSALLLAPAVLTGFGGASGFVAYGSQWQANDLLFRWIQWVVRLMPGLEADTAMIVARVLVAAAVCVVAVAINRRPADAPLDLCARAFVTIGALFLLSPTQFPWYYGWIAILLPVFPARGFLVLAATLPLYYAYFHFAARDQSEYFRHAIVWLIWLPCWALLIHDGLTGHRGMPTYQRGRVAEAET